MASNETKDGPTIQTVGRLAPSPTGGLHLGHARTFIIAWLSARGAGGRVILRIEDLDASRVRTGARRSIIGDLRWLGLEWDEGPDLGGPHVPYVQSERLAQYQAALDRLRASEQIYPCTCTRADIARAASAPHAEDEGPSYPGTCSHRRADDADALGDRPFAWRFRVAPGTIAWEDMFAGSLAFDPALRGGDFIAARNGIGPSYQLGVVVDDALMGVSEVIRGADLVTSTPRQLLLYRALGWREPKFGHVPLVLDEEGRRLAKRDNALRLSTLREAGVDREFLCGALIQSCGWSSSAIRRPAREWVGRVEIESLSREPWTVTNEWLDTLRRGAKPR
jgi:glutamyl-tRNA synthetase